ncbi:hypothetical protein [Caballeronia sp. LZ016]|uniref:hypothetical protein n=1 Tax=Caballeronia sp. LZ016 TaxID=3038554 RepID=UPI002856F570|nr:hypothetical protein [Caballeronia sp. LZ016]MDR5737003.1 hypothetical protein [Caballeronia sp. LZ016]
MGQLLPPGGSQFCCKAIQNYPRTGEIVQKLRLAIAFSKKIVDEARSAGKIPFPPTAFQNVASTSDAQG